MLLTSFHKIVFLDISNCRDLNLFDLEEENVFLMEEFFEEFKKIPSLKSIKYLVLDGVNISPFGVNFVLSLCPGLEIISLFACSQIDKEFVLELKEKHQNLQVKWSKFKLY